MDVARCGDALWRAVTYLSVAQLHLRANPLATRPLQVCDVKPQPSGHWGTVPGSAWALVHVGLAAGLRPNVEIIPVIGAGHAGVVQRALAWLTGALGKAEPRFGRDAAGLAALIASFPDVDGLGSEVHPELPAGAYMGGWLGGALAFAQGMALEARGRVVVPIVGDGECETPVTAASWLAQREIHGARVLPVVHLNGQRMGGPSLLGAMSDERVSAYARGLGWEPVIAHVGTGDHAEHTTFHHLPKGNPLRKHSRAHRPAGLGAGKALVAPVIMVGQRPAAAFKFRRFQVAKKLLSGGRHHVVHGHPGRPLNLNHLFAHRTGPIQPIQIADGC